MVIRGSKPRVSSSTSGLAAAVVALIAAWVSPAATRADGEGALVDERWYRIEISGTPAGWMSERETRENGLLGTESKLSMTIRRGRSSQTIRIESRFVESADGTPIEASAYQLFGAEPISTRYLFGTGTGTGTEDSSVVVESRAGNGSFVRRTEVARPMGVWLTPAVARERLDRLLADGAEAFTLRTVDPLLGIEPVETRWRPTGEETVVEVLGREYHCRRWVQTQSISPSTVTTVDVDERGTIVRSNTEFLGLSLTLTRWPEGPSEDSETVGDPPELLRRTFLSGDRIISRPREVTRAIYQLGTDMPIPSGGSQRVEEIAGGGGKRVIVDLATSPPLQPLAADDLEPYLRSSAYVDFEDSVVADPATAALEGVGEELDREARALMLREFVHGHLRRKDLSAVLATASEVARSRTGDCTEHSVLLAALLRSQAIPSRAVAGLVYVESFVGVKNVFGYHMWVQAWIEDRWVDLDATLGSNFDATHIALGYAMLNDDTPPLAQLAAMADLDRELGIEVIEVEYR